MDKPLLVNTEFLRPLPKSMWGIACATCDRTQAKWEVQAPRQEPVMTCSWCFLYESFWGRPLRRHVDELISEIEVSIGRMFERASDARLVRCEDADRVLGAVALSSRLFQVHDRMQGVRAGR